MRLLVNKYVFNLTVFMEQTSITHARVTDVPTRNEVLVDFHPYYLCCDYDYDKYRSSILICIEEIRKFDTHLWCCESSWKRALTKSTWTILLSWRWRRRHCCDYGRTRSVRVHLHSLNGGSGGGGSGSCGSCGSDRCPSPAQGESPAAAVVTCDSISNCLRTGENKRKTWNLPRTKCNGCRNTTVWKTNNFGA